MKTIKLIVLLVLPVYSFAQGPIIENAENFKKGMTLIFQQAEADGVSNGNSGTNQIWDFSSLEIEESETITVNMVAPGSTPLDSLFPKANLVEESSDGKFVYMLKKQNENHLLGFVNTKNDFIIKYENPMLFVKRPLKYGDTITDTYTTDYSVNGMDFSGKGTVTIHADGYGKLILPNKTYEHVLRVKITQIQNDTLQQYSTVSRMETIIYVWFDKNHTSALLKISETKSDYYTDKSVEYLLSETY